MSKILVATSNEALTSEVLDMLADNHDHIGMSVLAAGNLVRVDQLCRKHKDISFVVLSYDLPRGSAANDEAPNLLDLARKLDKDKRQGIVLGPIGDDSDRVELYRLTCFRTIDSQDSFHPTSEGLPLLVDQIRHMKSSDSGRDSGRGSGIAAAQRAEPVKKGVVEITIEDKNVGRCQTTVVINNWPMRHADETFHCDDPVFTDLLDFTKNLDSNVKRDNPDGVLMNFRSVGRKTREMLLDEDHVKAAIKDLIHQVGSTERVWFRFRVTRRTAPHIPFEAILRCDEQHDDIDAEFQLALSPVYRVTFASHLGRDLRPPLFTEAGSRRTPLNCLIINASTAGPPEPRRDLDFPSLDSIVYAREEAETVMNIIRQRYGDESAGVTRLIDFDDEGAKRDPVALLDRAFKETDWDLVHFIGHSFYEPASRERRESAYIFLPSDRFPVPVPITQFAGWLTPSSFVYLSSCESAETGFIQALAAKPIPTIVGYRWKVSDYGAKIFAKKFYENLFDPVKPVSIEEAFALTQRHLKDRSSGTELADTWNHLPIWVYPMLVMQNVG